MSQQRTDEGGRFEAGTPVQQGVPLTQARKPGLRAAYQRLEAQKERTVADLLRKNGWGLEGAPGAEMVRLALEHAEQRLQARLNGFVIRRAKTQGRQQVVFERRHARVLPGHLLEGRVILVDRGHSPGAGEAERVSGFGRGEPYGELADQGMEPHLVATELFHQAIVFEPP